MTASQIIFYLIAATILGFGFLSVITRKIFRAAIYLLFSLVGIAGLFFFLQYEFIAAVQIAVYVGGIVVLIIFSIFLTQQAGEDMKQPTTVRAILGVLSVLVGGGLVFLLITRQEFLPSANPSIDSSVSNIGTQMLDTQRFGFILPFEVVGMLLLAAMIGAIVIAMRQPFIHPKMGNGAPKTNEVFTEKIKTETIKN